MTIRKSQLLTATPPTASVVVPSQPTIIAIINHQLVDPSQLFVQQLQQSQSNQIVDSIAPAQQQQQPVRPQAISPPLYFSSSSSSASSMTGEIGDLLIDDSRSSSVFGVNLDTQLSSPAGSTASSSASTLTAPSPPSSHHRSHQSKPKSQNPHDIEFDGTTVLCRVCGDKASGFHYGVHSCEGCKGFFRRSIQQKIQYRPCTKNQQCSILRINRNRCQYCRLKKCIAVGMSRDAVRFGRVPKREKAKILAAMQKVNAHSLDKAMSVVLEDEHNISATIAKAHEETCDYTREKVAPLLEAARSRPIYAQCPPQMTCPLNPIPVGTMDVASQTARILEDFSERFSPAIRGVVEFAKRIPGFSMLSQEDQVTLLKAGVFEVLLVRLACMFDSANGSMVCLNGLVLRRDALHSASNARFLLDSMFDFADRLNSLRLSDHEVGLFCAVVVIAPDRPGIRNIDLVQKINKRLEEVLQKTIASNHPNDVASGNLIFSELTKKIPDLRTLNTLHSEKLLGKSFGVNLGGEQLQQPTVATSTSVLLFGQHSPAPSLIHPPHSPMDTTTSSTSSLVQCPMQSAAASLIVAQHQQSQQQHQQPDSSDNSPSDRWSSSSSLGHFSPATSTEDGRSVSPSSGPWNEHHSKDGGFGSPRSSSSGVSSDDSHSRKGSISLPSAPPKLAYINSYVRGMSSPLVVSSEHHAGMPVSSVEDSYHHHQVHHLHPYSSANGSAVTKSHHRVDSPTDSGIDHLGSSTTPTTSVCSSPARSAIEEATKKLVIASSPRSHVDHTASDSEGSEKQESIDDMPVLKRALQAPPLVNTNKLMDEAYRHHKKFRAAARRDTDPHSPSTTTGLSASQQQSVQSGLPRLSESSSALSNSISSSSLASTHSTLLKTLEQPSRYLSEQQLKRTDLIHNIIMSTEAVQAPGLSAPVISMHQAAASAQASPQSAYQAQLFSSTSSPNSSISPKAKENITVMYPQGYYHHIPVASTPNAGVCPYTGRSASSSGASSTGPVSTSPALHQFPLLSQHYAKSPEPGVAAAAAGLLVIGSSIPAAAPSPASVRSLSPMHQAPSPYSHLQRCLTATTAPIGLHGPSLLPPATAATNDLDDEDAQPLNLSKKASPSPLPVSYSPGPLVIATGSVSPAPSSIKMEAD